MMLVERGTREFRIITLSFFSAGFVTYMTLYDVQPLLPFFSREFGIDAAVSSLAVSVATGALAVSMLLAGTLSEAIGRKPVMVTSLILTSALALLTALTRSFVALLAIRLLQGIVLAGLPAVAMAYLGDEMGSASLSTAMGLYIAGNAVGGMAGRIFTVSMTQVLPWRAVIAIIGVVCIFLSVYFLAELPPSKNFHTKPFKAGALVSSLLRQLERRDLLCLYATGFLVMGAFVTTYNYITFRLLAPPYSLSRVAVGWIFAAYIFGSFSSALAGRTAGRFGRSRVLFVSLLVLVVGVALTLLRWIAGIVAGVIFITSGFFGAHSIASGWVPARAADSRGPASALYLFFYYLGSSICGTVGGLFFSRYGWHGVAAFIGALGLLAFGVLARLSRLPAPAGSAETATPPETTG